MSYQVSAVSQPISADGTLRETLGAVVAKKVSIHALKDGSRLWDRLADWTLQLFFKMFVIHV